MECNSGWVWLPSFNHPTTFSKHCSRDLAVEATKALWQIFLQQAAELGTDTDTDNPYASDPSEDYQYDFSFPLVLSLDNILSPKSAPKWAGAMAPCTAFGKKVTSAKRPAWTSTPPLDIVMNR